MTKKTVLATAIVAAGLAVAVPLAGADDEPQTTTAPAASGIYSLTREQIAYYEGFLAGRGYDTESDSPWVLSSLEIGSLMRSGDSPEP